MSDMRNDLADRDRRVRDLIDRWERGDAILPEEIRDVEALLADQSVDPGVRLLLGCIVHDVSPAPRSEATIGDESADPDVVESIMQRIPRSRARVLDFDRLERVGRSVGAAAAGLALLIGSIALLLRVVAPLSPEGAVAAVEEATIVVEFELYAPEAGTVSLVGDFNEWDPSRNLFEDPEGRGAWRVQVRVTPGEVYTYNFLIDGERWVPDPNATREIRDPFGGRKSVLSL
jgi:hypothetical protein